MSKKQTVTSRANRQRQMATEAIPPGIYPIFITMTTQEMFKVAAAAHAAWRVTQFAHCRVCRDF